MLRLSLNRSEPAKKSGSKYPAKSLPDNNSGADGGNVSGAALYRGSGRLFKPRPSRSKAPPFEKSRLTHAAAKLLVIATVDLTGFRDGAASSSATDLCCYFTDY